MMFQPPKGTRDFLPEEMAKRKKVFDACRTLFEKYGFGEVDTPAFESLDMLTAKGSLGQKAVKDIYRFEDKSKRKLGLRYDLTVPIVRLFLSQKFPKPVKWYYINKVWRYEDVTKGRWREFSQCDIEIIGSPLPEADSQILEVAIDCMLSLGIKNMEIRINSRKIMDEMADSFKITKKEEVFRALDKLAKKGEAEVRKELETLVSKKQAVEVIKFVKSGGASEELDRIISSLPEKYKKFVVQDFSITRGLDYYTGFVFETFVKGHESIGSVVSGGRYDKLIEKYGGEATPATGFGLGIDRLITVLDANDEEARKPVFLIPIGKAKNKVSGLSRDLRLLGVSCDSDLMGRSVSKQLEYASKRGMTYAIIVGEKELSSGEAKLRNMKTGKEKNVALDAGAIQKNL